MKKNILVLLFSFLVYNCPSFSQNKLIDSLETALKNNAELRAKLHKTTFDKSDTARVNTLNILSREFINKNKHDKALPFLQEALTVSKIIGFKRGEGDAYNNMGVSYLKQSDYLNSLKNLSISLEIAQQIGNKNGSANASNNIAVIYSMQGNYPEALKYHLISLKIREERKDKKGMATSYNNIGLVYNHLGNNQEALKYHTYALKIAQELNEKRLLINIYTNFGIIYGKQSNTTEALKNYSAALKISEELEDEPEIAKAYMNIGTVYYLKENFAEATKYNNKAMDMENANGNKFGMVKCLINASNLFKEIDNYKDAKKYLDSAIVLSKEINSNETTKEAYRILSELDSLTGNFQDAYLHHKQHIIYRDSLINDENTEKIVQSQMQYEFDKKEAATKAEQEKKELAQQKEIALKALQVEYEKKQAIAKSEKEKQLLKYEQQLKEQQINNDYNQKIAQAETEKKQQAALNKVLSTENTLMAANSKNETIIRWLMIAALIGFISFGLNYYRSYKRQQADNKQIAKQAEDLKILMKEVHHRVKNNLQIIVSMLRMQARSLSDKVAIDALIHSENRLQAIAIVHEKLYKSDNFTSVLLKDYLQELMDVLAKQNSNEAIPFQFTITDNAMLTTNLDTAIPLGLIVNELVTNSFKYAFTNVAKAVINIELNKTNNSYQLTIKDNGQGLPNGVLPQKPKSLGLRLVQLFTEQLNGKLAYETDGGASFTVSFA